MSDKQTFLRIRAAKNLRLEARAAVKIRIVHAFSLLVGRYYNVTDFKQGGRSHEHNTVNTTR